MVGPPAFQHIIMVMKRKILQQNPQQAIEKIRKLTKNSN